LYSKDQQALADYWVSEKYDGVRGYWDGTQLLTRSGKVIDAPDWFTSPLPAQPLDGELWIDRGRFSEVSGIVRTRGASDPLWRQITFMLFDLPGDAGNFDQRLAALTELVSRIDQPHVRLVKQQKVASEEALMQLLNEIIELGGEGLMLHRGDSHYRSGRSDDLLKLKTYHDAEARVIGHLPGNGKFQGMLGALVVELADGRQLRLGSGFSDQQRKQPPPVGAIVTFKYYGETSTGLPRFASFLRVRDDKQTLNAP